MTNSFLILLITIKAEIALILQGVSINTHYVIKKRGIGKKEEKISLHYSNSFPSPLPHTHLFFISLKKNILKEVEKNSLHSLFLSLPPT